jgi:hypothetical protein
MGIGQKSGFSLLKIVFFPVKMTTITISPHLHSREARGVFRSFSVRIDPLDPRKTKKRRQ